LYNIPQSGFGCNASLSAASSFGNINLANYSLVILEASSQDNLMLSADALTFRTVLRDVESICKG